MTVKVKTFSVFKWTGGSGRRGSWTLLATVDTLSEAERLAELNCRGNSDLYTEPGRDLPRAYFSKRSDDRWETSIRENP